MHCEQFNRRGTFVLAAACLFLASTAMASATTYDCNIPGKTLSIIVDPADPYRPRVVGNDNGVANPNDIKFVMEVTDGGFATPFAEFVFEGDSGGTLSYENMLYDCRVAQPSAAVNAAVATAGPLLETPGLSYGGKVRRGPGMQHAQVGSLAEGERIKIIRNTGVHFNGFDWFEVQRGDLIGYHWGGLICSNQPVPGVLQQC